MSSDTMPVLFLGHGSPMNAIEDSEYRRGWAAVAERLPKPRAVLCISAHWETPGVMITATEKPETIHDFYGFPRALFDVQYPAPGDPGVARETVRSVRRVPIALDEARGLDHGAWSVLVAMYPDAGVPIVQLSLDTRQPAAFHYELARELAPLRDQGVLVLGSGNIVHNLRAIDFRNKGGFDWAREFEAELVHRIRQHDHEALIDYQHLGPAWSLAIPTAEHFLPLLYCLALQRDSENVSLFNEGVVLGSISMTSLTIGTSTPRRESQV